MKPMISFNDQFSWDNFLSEIDENWIAEIAREEGKIITELDYIFCSDDYLLKINQDFLDHDTYTDIITFDYSSGRMIGGEIYISIERIQENAAEYKVTFEEELFRVVAHGVLHLCGYQDKTEKQQATMRQKEDFYIQKRLASK